jgi:hypothetical protein
LTTTNMIGLLYGAQKYMLNELKKMCEEFILKNTNNTNLLEVFDASQYFENQGKITDCVFTTFFLLIKTFLSSGE